MNEKNEKKYKLTPPVGSIVIPKEWMSEKDLREFIPQLVQDPSQQEIWKEKADKDPIENLLEWLSLAEYKVEIK